MSEPQCGWLNKYSMGKSSFFGVKNWKRRFFVSTERVLLYFDHKVNPKEPKDVRVQMAKGFIAWINVASLIPTATTVDHPAAVSTNSSKYFALKIEDCDVLAFAPRSYILLIEAPDEKTHQHWVTHIYARIGASRAPRQLRAIDSTLSKKPSMGRLPQQGTRARSMSQDPTDSLASTREPDQGRGDPNLPFPSPAVLANRRASAAPALLVKQMVSQKKKRLVMGDFDLDMAYINSQIIAMGFPAEGTEAYYRNDYADVFNFLETYHAGHYKVYNLCSERSYAEDRFHGNFARFPWEDHNPPPMSLLGPLCQDMKAWLGENRKNIVCVHCKAGKGRTGVAIIAYLMHSGTCSSLHTASTLFNTERTLDGHGVEVPSQRRYLGYYEKVVRDEVDLSVNTPVRLTRILLTSTPHFDCDGGCDPYFRVLQRPPEHTHKPMGRTPGSVKQTNNVLFDFKATVGTSHVTTTKTIELKIPGGLMIEGDIRFEFFDHDDYSHDDEMFEFWINTSFLPKEGVLSISREDLDTATKDKKHEYYDEDFACVLYYNVGQAAGSGSPRNSSSWACIDPDTLSDVGFRRQESGSFEGARTPTKTTPPTFTKKEESGSKAASPSPSRMKVVIDSDLL